MGELGPPWQSDVPEKAVSIWQKERTFKGGIYLMVITQQLVKEIDGFVRDKSLVLRCHKAVPRLLLEVAQDVIVLSVQFNLILVKVVEEIVGSEDLGNLDKLI